MGRAKGGGRGQAKFPTLNQHSDTCIFHINEADILFDTIGICKSAPNHQTHKMKL